MLLKNTLMMMMMTTMMVIVIIIIIIIIIIILRQSIWQSDTDADLYVVCFHGMVRLLC